MKTHHYKSLLGVLFVILCFQHIQSQSMLLLKFQDKSNQSVSLDAIRKIVFNKDNFEIKQNDGSESTYTFLSVAKISFSSTATGRLLVNNDDEIILYPNPVQNVIYLKNTVADNLPVVIYNLSGCVLMSAILSNTGDGIDISSLSKGFYLLKIKDKTFKFSKL